MVEDAVKEESDDEDRHNPDERISSKYYLEGRVLNIISE